MTSGKIQFAENDGTYLLKLTGEVRLNLCPSLEAFVERIFSEPDFKSVIVDLSETDTIDSTSLGLLAKLSIRSKKELGLTPIIISTKSDVNRILESMSLDTVFRIVQSLDILGNTKLSLHDISCEGAIEQCVQTRRVLDAHKVLMNMNDDNRQAFSDLVEQLEKLQKDEKKKKP